MQQYFRNSPDRVPDHMIRRDASEIAMDGGGSAAGTGCNSHQSCSKDGGSILERKSGREIVNGNWP